MMAVVAHAQGALTLGKLKGEEESEQGKNGVTDVTDHRHGCGN